MVHRAAAGAYGECEKLGTVNPKQKGNVQTVICSFAQPFAPFLENSFNVLFRLSRKIPAEDSHQKGKDQIIRNMNFG